MTFNQMTRIVEEIFPDAIFKVDDDGQIVIETRAQLSDDGKDRIVNMAD
jgi:hypothetical protein